MTPSDTTLTQNRIHTIPGAEIIFDFISEQEEARLIHTIDQQPWLTDLKRRVQHYGYKYDYRARKIDSSLYLGPLPEWLSDLQQAIGRKDLMEDYPDQAIVNEYFPGQGISLHTDCEPCFTDTILTLSLGSPAVMEFKKKEEGASKLPVLLPPRSLLKISGEARYHWYHGIPARKKDRFNDRLLYRERRMSVTFRKVII